MRIVNPETPEGWRAWMAHFGIGAGELAAVRGIDHRRSPRQLYEDKMRQPKNPSGAPPAEARSSNPVIREGKEGEAEAREALAERTAVSGEQYIICDSPRWLKVQIDAMAELGAPGEIEWSGPAEIKIPGSAEAWDEIRTQGRQHPAIYSWHYSQIQAQIYATGRIQGLLWVWHRKRGGIWCRMYRDDDFISQMLEEIDDWVRRYLYGDEEPPIDNEGAVADMSKEPAWRDEAEELVADRQRKRELKKEEEGLDRRIKAREQRMVPMLGDHRRGKGHGVSIVAAIREQQIAYTQAAKHELDEEVLEQYRPAPRIEIRSQLTDDAHPLSRPKKNR